MNTVIRNVAIVGGTHGNERIGIHLVNKFTQRPHSLARSHLSTTCIIGNPQACLQNQRYIETDLNRCFLKNDLENAQLVNYEAQQAKALYQHLGPKGNTERFLIDLHSTTANMGLTLILVNDHPFNLQLAAYLTHLNPLVKVYRWTQSGKENAFVSSICELGFAIEVGPIPQGILDASLFQQTEQLIHQILDYLDLVNQGKSPEGPLELTFYQHLEVLDYPKTANGELAGMIHPQRQGQDYQFLDPGEPLFLTFDGETINFNGTTRVWPIFINEAAYYEKGIAMCLTQKQHLSI